MPPEPTPKKPRKKDAAYMRRAYIYTAIILVLGLIGGLLLADRIIVAEENREYDSVEQQQSDEDEPTPPQPGQPPPRD